MAKFCGNCGAQMDDAAKICGNCGTPFAGASAPVKYEDPEKKAREREKLQKVAKKYGVIALAALVVIIAISVIIANTGSNGLVKKVLAAHEDYEIDTLVALSSDMYYYGSTDYAENYFEAVVGGHHDFLEDNLGHDYRMSYEVVDSYDMSKRNLEDTIDNIVDQFPNFDVDTIDKITVAVVELRATKSGDEMNMIIEVVMSKEDGEWRLLYIH